MSSSAPLLKLITQMEGLEGLEPGRDSNSSSNLRANPYLRTYHGTTFQLAGKWAQQSLTSPAESRAPGSELRVLHFGAFVDSRTWSRQPAAAPAAAQLLS